MKKFWIGSRFTFWTLWLGVATGILGITLSIVQLTNFYLKEGATQKNETYIIRIDSSENGALSEETLMELRNVEGIEKLSPYFIPNEPVFGSINFLGFQLSHQVSLKGVPKEQGIKSAKEDFKSEWSSANLSKIPVLVPQQAISLYNSVAPKRGWPTLQETAFLGMPGVSIQIGKAQVPAIITGFDKNEFGTVVTVPSEKLFALYKEQNLDPEYTYIDIHTMHGLRRKEIKKLEQELDSLGYQITAEREETIQYAVFSRIKIFTLIIGGSVFLVVLILKFFASWAFFLRFREQISWINLWGIKNMFLIQILGLSLLFGVLTGILSWMMIFFVSIPAQEYMIYTLSQIGVNTPPLTDAVNISLFMGVGGTIVYIFTDCVALFLFYLGTPKVSYGNYFNRRKPNNLTPWCAIIPLFKKYFKR